MVNIWLVSLRSILKETFELSWSDEEGCQAEKEGSKVKKDETSIKAGNRLGEPSYIWELTHVGVL